MRKGKGRPDITEVMFYPEYPSGSNSSFDSINDTGAGLSVVSLAPVRKLHNSHLLQ